MTPTEQDLRAFLDWLASEQRTDSAARAARRLAQLSLEELANGRPPGKYPRVALRDSGRDVASMTASEQAKADIRTTALHKFFTGNRRQIESWIVANGRQGIVALQLRDHQPAQGAGGEKVFWLERAAVPTVDTAPTPETDIGANVQESSPLPEQHLVDYQMSYCSGPDLSAWGRFTFCDGRLRRGHWRWKLLAARVLISVFGAGSAVVIALLIALTTKSGDISLKLAFEAATMLINQFLERGQ